MGLFPTVMVWYLCPVVYNVNKKTLSTIFNSIPSQTILNMFNIFTDDTITTIFNKLSPYTTIRIITIKPDLKKYITNNKIYSDINLDLSFKEKIEKIIQIQDEFFVKKAKPYNIFLINSSSIS